jgi:hypothetical protein
MSKANSVCSTLLAISGVVLCNPAIAGHVVNGNLESGNTLFSSEYSPTDFLCTNGHGGPGTYLLATNPADVNCYGDWASFGDHTSGSGLMMIVDGAPYRDKVIWSETIRVRPNTTYEFRYWTTSVNANGNGAAGILQVYVNGGSVGTRFQMPYAYDGWHLVGVTWDSGSATQATIWLVDLNRSGGWNDFALDDFSLRSK